MKYIYSYGGIGGSGSGGSGSGGGQAGTPTLFISIGGHPIKSGPDNVIILNKPDVYTIEMNVNNGNGNLYAVKVDTEDHWQYSTDISLNTDNRYKARKDINLESNGRIMVEFYDVTNDLTLDAIVQSFIVTPHSFDVKFKYEYDNGSGKTVIKEFANNEYFIGDVSVKNPYIESTFKIDLPNVTNISLEYHIGDTDESEEEEHNGQGIKNDFTLSNDTFKIYIDKLTRNDIKFTDESNIGSYVVKVTLRYTVNGSQQTDEKEFKITLIPGYLYINVRNPLDLLYDTLDNLYADEQNDIPRKNLPAGVYTHLFCKLYEGPMTTTPGSYVITFNVYNAIDEDEFEDVPTYSTSITVTEQVETPKPIQVVFDSPGIKKLVFSTVGKKHLGNEQPTIKYIYIKEPDTNIEWYPADLDQKSFYFRANKGNDTWSIDTQTGEKSFPDDWGTSELIMSETGSSKELKMDAWNIPGDFRKTTILSIGMQYSSVNKDHSEIFSTYAKTGNVYSDRPDVTLYSDQFFDKSIFIPTENNFNVSQSTQYHLIQIVRHMIDQVGSEGKFATYLYIDGKLESNSTDVLTDRPWFIGKIKLNNVNVIYNLINIQYVKMDIPSMVKENQRTTTIDELIYQYWLAYKSIMFVGNVTESESALLQYMPNIKFDGENTIVNDTFVSNISPYMPIPTMMFEYGAPDENGVSIYTPQELEAFKKNLFRSYGDGDNESFGSPVVTLYWCDGMKNNVRNVFKKLKDPEITVNDVKYTGDWKVRLQGTSTMRNKIKNFSLVVETKDEHGDNKKILISPNYSSNDYTTFLPETEWTIKADIADSAHANNTAVGKFVNRACTHFSDSNGTSFPTGIKEYIKNTLEGFPILMYFKIGTEIYYLGVYNFNMGRESYFNLGYHIKNDMVTMKNNIQPFKFSDESVSPFSVSLGTRVVIDTLAIGEVQENNPEYDFHQYNESVLFKADGDTTNRSCMFGKLVGNTVKDTLKNFVKSVSFAGAYCFANIGKIPVSSKKDEVSTECINRYNATLLENGKYREEVPDISWQFYYRGRDKVWYNAAVGDDVVGGNVNNTYTEIGKDVNNLLNCIYETDLTGELHHPFYLDFPSVSEYYTVCMAFGLVDSIVKNMNIKSWDGYKCYVAFYDMDCAFGEDNNGEETVSYLAASDYWHSNIDNNGVVQRADIIHDYWPQSANKGFDYTSSYLFAIAKYAQAILSKQGISLNNYPQEFWAKLRRVGQPLENAESFIDNFFSSGIGKIPAYMASMNYQVKYLYKGIKEDIDQGEIITYLANGSAFNGTRLEKVKDWLNRRLHFLDVVFNVPGISLPICDGTYSIPKAEGYLNDLYNNLDIVILSDAFSRDGKNTGLITNPGTEVEIYAPENTPCIICRGQEQQDPYILGAGVGKKNVISINSTATQRSQVFGSKEFTNMSMVDPLLTTAAIINSNNLEEIIYGGTQFSPRPVDFFVYSTSVKKIQMNIPTFSGQFTIDTTQNVLNGQALNELDLSGSGFYGVWSELKNLKKLNISSINSPGNNVTVSGCPLLTGGDNCKISGKNPENPTTLNRLVMSGVSGTFELLNTKIQEIQFDAVPDQDASFTISGDPSLISLTLTGFKEVVISDCPNLNELNILDYTGKPACEKIIIDIPLNDDENLNYIHSFKSSSEQSLHEGVFDFTGFQNLKTLGVSGCKGVVNIKIPNHLVSIETFRNNQNLEFIDTTGEDSVIELTKAATFQNSPRYCMRQSWWSRNGADITTLSDDSAKLGIYTKMCIRDRRDGKIPCTTLAHTFNKIYASMTPNYTSDNPYTNVWGQKVYNRTIEIGDAQYFIETIVGGGKLNDAHIEKRVIDGVTKYIIVDSPSVSNHKSYCDDCRENIESLSYCFYKQTGIKYTINSHSNEPSLSKYTSLNDISYMYNGTGVTLLTSNLLSLPQLNNNTNDIAEGNEGNKLSWNEFVQSGNWNMTLDAFKNISYRITDLSSMQQITVYKDINDLVILNEDDGYLDVVSLLWPKKVDETDTTDYVSGDPDDDYSEYNPFTRLTYFSTFSINSRQYVDYRRLFKLCPNVTSLDNFLNCDLSKAKIDKIMYPCKKIESIVESFNHNTYNMNTMTPIDLYEFFNWSAVDAPTLFANMKSLFTSRQRTTPGFAINKYISNEHFKEIIGTFHNYTNSSFTSLSNIFSYCTINGYDGSEIKLEGDLNNVININALFYKCKTDNDEPLNIKRSFFKHLPNVKNMANTFFETYWHHMPSYDFFCKRKNITDTVYVKLDESQNISNSNRKEVTLHKTGYDKNNLINDMYNCFCSVKFKDCKCWFDPEDYVGYDTDILTPSNEYLTEKNSETVVNKDTYYIYNVGVYVPYEVSIPDEVADTQYNFTNYVPQLADGTNGWTIDNHNLDDDLSLFDNKKTGYPYEQNSLNIYPTYCCLPPDILYACTYNCDFTNLFADTNIIGVIPQHLLKNNTSCTVDDMLRNVNILPNVIYHYDKNTENDETYLDIINGNYTYLVGSRVVTLPAIPIDETIITIKKSDDIINYDFEQNAEATVLYRDSNGKLKRRRPIVSAHSDDIDNPLNIDTINSLLDYSKSQFTYVPQVYISNSILQHAFTFRYNLPMYVNLTRSSLEDYGINWAPGSYDNSYNPDNMPYMWPYYTQYFFTVDESIDWERINNMNYPFINDSQDIDFNTGESRIFSSDDPNYTNKWWFGIEYVNCGTWTNKTNGNFNVFLNLCGKRNIRTGQLQDCGCLISKPYGKKNNPKLESFVSGSLVTFLNGRVFDDELNGAKLESPTNGSGKIIQYPGFGKNIIMPRFTGISTNQSKILLYFPTSNTYFYGYMFPDNTSLSNYISVHLLGANIREQTDDNTLINKYIVVGTS